MYWQWMSKLRRNWIRMSNSRRSNRIKLDRIGSVRCENALTVAECDVLEVCGCAHVCEYMVVRWHLFLPLLMNKKPLNRYRFAFQAYLMWSFKWNGTINWQNIIKIVFNRSAAQHKAAQCGHGACVVNHKLNVSIFQCFNSSMLQ